MKKSVIKVSLIGALICITATGCGSANSTNEVSTIKNITAASSTVASTTATTNTVSNITTSAATSSADITTSFSAANNSEKPLANAANNVSEKSAKADTPTTEQIEFGASATADTPLLKEAAAGADVLDTIPAYTQIQITGCCNEKWFMTEFNGKQGYVARGTVRDITPFDPELNDDFSSGGYIDTTSASVKLMSGIHKYSEVLAEIPANTQVNYYTSSFDANWSIVNFDGNIGYVESRFIKELEDYDFAEDNSDSFVGLWGCDRCSIRIQKTGNAYNVEIHWANSASEDNVWYYTCTLSDDRTHLLCEGTGKRERITTAEDGTLVSNVIYDDCSAWFTKKGGTLFWQENKEGIADQMGFEKIV